MYQRKGFFSNDYHTEETLKPKPAESKKKKAEGPEFKNLSVATLPHGFEVTYEDKGAVVSIVYDGKGAVVGTKTSPIVLPEVRGGGGQACMHMFIMTHCIVVLVW